MAETKLKSQAINIDSIYPVGSIYITTVSTNPSNYFGGTWVAFGAGKTLVGLDSGDTDFDTSEETGGAKTHTLTTAQMPSHTHPQQNSGTDVYGFARMSANANAYLSSSGSARIKEDYTTYGSAGGGEAHNNLQPYIVTYFWKRVS